MLSRIEEDLKAAMKAGEKRRVGTLRLLLANLKNEKIREQRALSNEEIEAVIRRAVKQRREAIEQYGRGGRQDLVDAETEELAILEGYLPRTLSEEELESVVRGIITEKGLTSGKDVGLLMKELMARHKGHVDGKRAQEMARRLLP
ncbi:MAG TPA: GatB/YqeY domain-containing protein [Thermoanaerobaculia bacterium]|nr:GatB/YqeY domain-containing protein [Thermoanaerobaculia bacterium]